MLNRRTEPLLVITSKLVDILFFIMNIAGFSAIYLTLLLLSVIDFNTYCVVVFVTALFYTKIQLDKIDLENQIFELKELIKDANTKT